MPVFPNLANLLAGYLLKSILTTKGDLYVATGAGVVVRQAVGSNDQVLTADSVQTNGIKWAAAAGGGGSANTYDPTVVYVEENFLSGNASSGSIGRLGWIWSGLSITALASEAGKPGIYRFLTAATNPSTGGLHPRATASNGLILPGDQPWEMGWIFRPRLNAGAAAATKIRVGMSNDPTTAGVGSNGIYLEKLDADTNWFFVTRAFSAETRTDTTVAFADDTWVRVRIRRATTSSNILFSVNAAAEGAGHSANIPTTVLHPHATISTSEAVAKHVDAHLFYLKLTGMTGRNFA